MTENKDTVSGKVARVVPWSKGNGYFFNLDGNSNDFYGFGSCKLQPGQEVNLEVSPGTGNFSDKVKLDKVLGAPDFNKVRKETADKDMEIVNKSIESGEKTYFERQNLIIRQTCIKAGARLVAAKVQIDESLGKKDAAIATCDAAEILYDWVTGREPPLPEPPEEP